MVARLGGDEFAILFSEINREAAARAVGNLQSALSQVGVGGRLEGIVQHGREAVSDADGIRREHDQAYEPIDVRSQERRQERGCNGGLLTSSRFCFHFPGASSSRDLFSEL
jgi:GGDEF domain-containing protein